MKVLRYIRKAEDKIFSILQAKDILLISYLPKILFKALNGEAIILSAKFPR